MGKLLLTLLLATAASWASSIYQIQFVGTFNDGAFAFTFGLDGNGIQQDLSGFTLRGKINIAMDALPAPQATNPFETAFETIGKSPLWLLNAEFSVDNLVDIPNSVFESGPYFVESAPVPADGTNLQPPVYEQRFGVIESLQHLRVGVSTDDFWTNPSFVSFRREGIWSLIAQGLSASPYDPQTGEFRAISGTPSFSAGFVRYQSFRSVDDATQGNFGVIENSFVNGTFLATSVTGDVVVPEPGTWWVAASGLCGLVLWRRQQKC